MASAGNVLSEGAQLRNLADNLPGGMVFQVEAVGEARRFVYVSRGVEALFGISVAEALVDPMALYGRILPRHIPKLQLAEKQAMEALSPFLAEVEIASAANAVRWVQISSAPRQSEDGGVVWDGFVLDITLRKRAELAHARSERTLALAAEAAGIGIWSWDIESGRFHYSDRARAIYGFLPETEITFELLRGRNVAEDNAEVIAALERALDPERRSQEVYRYRIRRADTGDVRWILAHGHATFEERDGSVKAQEYVGTLQDVTELTEAVAALSGSEARQRLAIEAGRMAVWELDVARMTVTPSPTLNRLYGFPEDSVPSYGELRSRYAPGEAERVEREGAAALARGETQFQVEALHILPDGTERWLATRAQLFAGADGKPQRVIGVVMDVTERRKAEDRQALLARELQHRVKNTLAVVQTLAAQTFRDNRPYKEALSAFYGRLKALAAATDTVANDAHAHLDLRSLVERVTDPFGERGVGAFSIAGPDIGLPPSLSTSVAMALHELSTNAAKYGALSVPTGQVRIEWEKADSNLRLRWTELGGPTVTEPTSRGFGTRLLQRGLFSPDDGSVSLRFLPTGVSCEIHLGMAKPS